MLNETNQPSANAIKTLAVLKRAVQNTLERKRRLGHYAVVWRDGKPALLHEDVEDRDAFYESLQDKLVGEEDSNTSQSYDPQSGVAGNDGEYRTDSD